jgi:hypothetical protein
VAARLGEQQAAVRRQGRRQLAEEGARVGNLVHHVEGEDERGLTSEVRDPQPCGLGLPELDAPEQPCRAEASPEAGEHPRLDVDRDDPTRRADAAREL